MKKIRFAIVSVLVLGLSFSVQAATSTKVNAELKSQIIKVSGEETTSNVIMYSGKTYVPLRQAGTLLGTSVDYKGGIIYLGSAGQQTGSNADQSASTNANKKIKPELKNQSINVSGNNTKSDVIIYNNQTYVPLREAGTLLGTAVDYKDGIIYLGSQNTVDEDDTGYGAGETVVVSPETVNTDDGKPIVPGSDWLKAHEGYSIYYRNDKCNAKIFFLDDSYTELTPEEFIKSELTNKKQYKNASIEKITDDLNCIYVESTDSEGNNQLMTFLIWDGGSVQITVLQKFDNSDPSALKDELLTFMKQDLAE